MCYRIKCKTCIPSNNYAMLRIFHTLTWCEFRSDLMSTFYDFGKIELVLVSWTIRILLTVTTHILYKRNSKATWNICLR